MRTLYHLIPSMYRILNDIKFKFKVVKLNYVLNHAQPVPYGSDKIMHFTAFSQILLRIHVITQ